MESTNLKKNGLPSQFTDTKGTEICTIPQREWKKKMQLKCTIDDECYGYLEQSWTSKNGYQRNEMVHSQNMKDSDVLFLLQVDFVGFYIVHFEAPSCLRWCDINVEQCLYEWNTFSKSTYSVSNPLLSMCNIAYKTHGDSQPEKAEEKMNIENILFLILYQPVCIDSWI